MGWKRVNSSVDSLVRWVEGRRESHSDLDASDYLVFLEVKEKKILLSCIPYINARVVYVKTHLTLSEKNFSLYYLSPLIPAYSRSRTMDLAEKASSVLASRGFFCDVDNQLG